MKKRIRLLSLVLVLAMLFGMLPLYAVIPSAAGALTGAEAISKENKEMRLWYDEPAPDDDGRAWKYSGARNSGWETRALALGNSYMGAKVFGLTERERIQISENSLSTSGGTQNSGTTNFTETYLHFDHTYADVTDYERDLILNDATSHVTYTYGGVTYEREYFTSYPDKVMLIKLTASEAGALSFTLEPKIPYYEFEGRTGDVIPSAVNKDGEISVATLTLEGNLPGSNISSTEAGYSESGGTVGYDMDFEAQFRVFATGGTVITGYNAEGGTVDDVDEYSNGTISVEGADSAYIIIALGTNYEMDPQVFLQGNNSLKLDGFPHPHEKVTEMIDAASEKSYDELREAHIADYTELFSRVALNLTGEMPSITTDELLDEYRAGNYSLYVEELLFAFGRYTLIASSRNGNLPPNLNGIWNMYHNAICLNGYWGNVNIQMNFWSAFNTDLAECFESYVQLYNAYIQSNHNNAVARLISRGAIRSADEVEGTLWSIETGMTPFKAPAAGGGRDGWANTPFMAESFWDYYDYTRDGQILSEVSLPALIASANFLSLLMEYDEQTGLYLAPNSGSPEQSTTAPFISYVEKNPGYVPEGSTYDQSLTYSNYLHVLQALEYIDESSLSEADRAVIARIREQIDKLDPIPIGLSGQVKEFREEQYYGEIGEPDHRHISHLATLYPGSVINVKTDAWLDAAEFSLDSRGGSAIWGWSNVHRILGYARTLNGNAAYGMVNNLIIKNVSDNMWTLGGGNFQVEANLGAPSAIAEMLLQSHNGYIQPLAALPDAWAKSGSYSGLVARGNFSVGAAWEDGLATVFTVTSRSGGEVSVYYPGIASASVVTSGGSAVSFTKESADLITFNTTEGQTYTITGFEAVDVPEAPETLGYSTSALGKYDLACSAVSGAAYYNLYVAHGNAANYTLVESSRSGRFSYEAGTAEENSRTTFAVTAVNTDGRESERTLAYYVPTDLTASVNSVTGNVLESGDLQVTVNANGNTEKYRLYSKLKTGGDYTLLAESVYPIIDGGAYNSSCFYYVSVVSFYDSSESELVQVSKYGSSASVEYNAANILSGKTFVAGEFASDTHSGVHSGVTVYYDYTKLTDGGTHYQTGRFSTVSNDKSQVLDGTVDLGGGYILNELQIYDFNGTATTAPFMGTGLEIQVYSLGEWTTVATCATNDEIITHRVGTSYLSFDLGGIRAEKIRLYIPARLSGNSISINEIKCSGVVDTAAYDYSDNLLLGKSFVPTASAAGVVHIDSSGNNYDYGYPTITDGLYTVAGGRFSTLFASTEQHVDATVELGGTHILGELRIFDYAAQLDPNKSNPTYAGTSLLIEVYSGGAWHTAVECAQADYAAHRVFVSNTFGGAYLAFDLGGVEAEKIRVYMPKNVSGSSISFYEITCSGYLVGDAAVIGDNLDIVSGKEFVPGEDAAYCHANTTGYDGDYGYAKLTDGVFNYRNGRMSTKSGTTHIFDASVDFGGTFKLDKIWLYDYNGQVAASWDSPTFAGKDLRIDARVDGVWVTVVDCSQADYGAHRGGTAALYGAYLEFDLGGVIADGLRIYQSGGYSTNAISYHEIKVFADVYTYPSDLSNRENVFAELTGVSASGTVDSEYPLSNILDGSTSTYAKVDGDSWTLTLDFGETKLLKALKIYEYLDPANLIDGVLSTASDSTAVEVYRDGVWLTVHKGVSLTAGLFTELDMFGVECSKVRFTFENTRLFDGESEYRGAVISEISCITSSKPVDRTALLNAYKALESVDVSGEFGFDVLLSDALAKYKAYLSDTEADAETVAAYVAEVENYTDTAMVGTGLTDEYASNMTFNLSLAGDIALNLYYALSDQVLSANPDAFVVVEQGGKAQRVYLSELTKDSSGRYKITVSYAAAQMTDTVTMRLFLNENTYSSTYTGSVVGYAERVLADSATYEEQYPGITALLEAMLNYGGYAQTYFGYNTDNMANKGIEAPDLDSVTTDKSVVVSGSATGIVSAGWTLSLESETHIKLIFAMTEGASVYNYTFTVTDPAGNTVEVYPVALEGGYYYVKVENIPAAYLDNDYTVVMTNTLDGAAKTVTVSAECYLASALGSGNEALVNLIKAMCLYNKAANAYFGK